MFVYEKIENHWLQKLNASNFKKPLEDGLPAETHWYINHEKNEAIYYIGWVSDAILRCDGESMYEFAYIYKDNCIHVTAYIFPPSGGKQWNDKNRLIYNRNAIAELDKDVLEQNLMQAIVFYLENSYKDRRKKARLDKSKDSV